MTCHAMPFHAMPFHALRVKQCIPSFGLASVPLHRHRIVSLHPPTTNKPLVNKHAHPAHRCGGKRNENQQQKTHEKNQRFLFLARQGKARQTTVQCNPALCFLLV
ncbi:unnamed protein product [Pseudo-nitzschia multistriata]|uniref:Uncharacterized protein n=1 Tax=Pseudo-nitzschia multistriata TaxID=183589 RepID=A0A448Z3T5_9STRA|nr:unnamed protein product [Pseudo-nitzschia multistriata]